MSKRYSGKSFKDSSVMKKPKLTFKEKRKLKEEKKKKRWKTVDIERENLTYWPYFEIPEIVEGSWNGENIKGFPALIAQENFVNLNPAFSKTYYF